MKTDVIRKMIKGAGLATALAFGLFAFAGTTNAQIYYPGNAPYYGNNGRWNDRDRDRERKEYQKMYQKGYKEGFKDGERVARDRGRNNRNIFGGIFNNGNGRYNNGRYASAFEDGYRRGYDDGLRRNRNTGFGRIFPF